MIQVRMTTETDLDDIARVRETSWIATYPNEEHGITELIIRRRLLNKTVPVDREERARNLSNAIANENKLNLIVTIDGGAVIGFLFGEKFETYNELHAMYIEPDHQRKGAGHALMKHFVGWCDSTKNTKLHVVQYNVRAIEFYKKWGFEISEKRLPPFEGIQPIFEMIRPADERDKK